MVHLPQFIFIPVIVLYLTVISHVESQEQDDDITSYWTDNLRPVGEVGKLIQKHRENKLLVENIPSRFYEIIYPVQVRHHQKLGISTRDANDRSGKHFSRTSLLIKAFNHKLRLELELNTFLLGPQLIQKHFLPGDAQQISSQEIEHCYYHGRIKDYPGGRAAFRTCNGVSGVIHLNNETFVIHPFEGGDLSRKHPHVIYRASTKRMQKCGNSANHEWGYAHFRRQKYKHKLKRSIDSIIKEARARKKRDVREVTKYIELALILDRKMFQMRNVSRTVVVNDAIQICNVADMYLRDVKTQISVVYIETWKTNDQFEVSSRATETLLNFANYANKKLYKVKRDNAQLLTGQSFRNGEVGMAYPDTICTASSVGIVEDSSLYEPHLAAVTMVHVIGHNVGMRHDTNDCKCTSKHGCIMNETILGAENKIPYLFSDCSINSYIDILRKGYAICLFNKPHQLEDFNTCGNGIVEGDEECDCGTQSECQEKDPCCEAITCKLKKESQCASGPCCQNCQLRDAGHPCRVAGDNECDIPEFCNGKSGQCPPDTYKRNGVECNKGLGYCFNGKCPTRDERCIDIWGFSSRSSEGECYERFNSEGTFTGNCGTTRDKRLIKCDAQNLFCGTLHCQNGADKPMILNMTIFSRTIIAIRGAEYECKVASGNISNKVMDISMVPDGAKCGNNMICYQKKCQSIEPFIPTGSCPSNHVSLECSGNGICSNNNTCFCNKGWVSPMCHEKANDKKRGYNRRTTVMAFVLPPSPTTAMDYENSSNFGNIHLVLIFSSVVGAVFLFFAFIAICYRRKSVRPTKEGPYSIKTLNGNSQSPKIPNSKDTEDVEENASRIKFGNMPSYRQERDDKLMELKRQRMRQHRHNSRDSGSESQADDETVSFIELQPNNLSKLPEKGILKHGAEGGKSDKDKWMDEPSESDNQDICSQSDNNRGSDALTDVETTLKSLNGYHEDILEALRSAASRSGTSHSTISDELRKSLLSSDGFSDFDASALFKSSSENLAGSTSNEDLAAMASAADSVPPCGPIRIRNLEDLIRQLERHNLQMSGSTRHISPSGSEDVRLSETEADRHYHTLDGRGCRTGPILTKPGDSQGPSRGLHFKFGGSKSKHKKPLGAKAIEQPGQSTSSDGPTGVPFHDDDDSENDECVSDFLNDHMLRSASEEAFPVTVKPHYSYERNMNFKQPHQKTLKLESCDYFPSPPSESSYASSATQDNGSFPPPPPPPPIPPLISNGGEDTVRRKNFPSVPNVSSKPASSCSGAKNKKNKKFPEYKH